MLSLLLVFVLSDAITVNEVALGSQTSISDISALRTACNSCSTGVLINGQCATLTKTASSSEWVSVIQPQVDSGALVVTDDIIKDGRMCYCPEMTTTEPETTTTEPETTTVEDMTTVADTTTDAPAADTTTSGSSSSNSSNSSNSSRRRRLLFHSRFSDTDEDHFARRLSSNSTDNDTTTGAPATTTSSPNDVMCYTITVVAVDDTTSSPGANSTGSSPPTISPTTEKIFDFSGAWSPSLHFAAAITILAFSL